VTTEHGYDWHVTRAATGRQVSSPVTGLVSMIAMAVELGTLTDWTTVEWRDGAGFLGDGFQGSNRLVTDSDERSRKQKR
jgi:hypothetical protein